MRRRPRRRSAPGWGERRLAQPDPERLPHGHGVFADRQSDRHSSCRLRLRHDILALLAGAGFLAVEEFFVGFRHRVSAVVADHTLLLVQQCIALGAIPLEAIDLTLAPLPLDH